MENKEEVATRIHWKQLFSLSALYGSVIIGWIAYYRYQPKLLVQYNFTEFTFLLVVIQAVILVITPPIAGRMGDRFRFNKGHRLPIITAGMSFAAMIFMAVAFTLIANPGDIFRWVLPVLIVCWLVGMSIFTSPALSTVELFAPVDKLPRAMAVLAIVSNLIYSLEPVIVDIIDYLGATITFIAGGAAVFLSGYALKKTSLNLFKTEDQHKEVEDSRSAYTLIFVLGAGLGYVTTVLFNYFPEHLEQVLSAHVNAGGNVLVVAILVLAALVSLPMSAVVTKIGLRRSYWRSLFISVIAIAGILGVQSVYVVIPMMIIFAMSFAMLSVTSLPLVIQASSFREKVFCVGIFYSGVALPDGIVETLLAL